MSDLFSIRDKVVIVTGANGNLGNSYCRALERAGANVVALDLEQPQSDGLDSKAILRLKCDITKKCELQEVARRVIIEYGRIDGLVNNAAIDTPPGMGPLHNGKFESFPEEIWDQVHRVNLKGTFLCCQVFGTVMAEKKHGSIVNIGSIYGVVSPDQTIYDYLKEDGREFYKPIAYSSSKSALYNFTKYLGVYWARSGVRVNILTLAGVLGNQDQRFLRSYTSRIPIGRMANPNEYDGAVIFLLSEASKYMTGSELRVDGGWTAI